MSLADVLKEKNRRRKAREKTPEKAKDWPEFRGLTDEAIIKKLEKLSESDMIEIYKRLEKESGFPSRPENYNPRVIVKCFMIQWNRKLKDEERAAKAGKPCIPMTEAEIEKIFSTGPSKMSGPVERISDPGRSLERDEW